MDWKDVGQFVAKAAPVLGAALGGPVGLIAGAAGSLVASALGAEPAPEAVMAALQASPESLLKLREIEAGEKTRLLDWQSEQLRAELDNLRDARAREVGLARAGQGMAGWLPPAAISGIVTIGFLSMLWLMFTTGKDNLGEGGMLLLGSLSTAFGAVVNYYLGSSLGSSRKDGLLAGK